MKDSMAIMIRVAMAFFIVLVPCFLFITLITKASNMPY